MNYGLQWGEKDERAYVLGSIGDLPKVILQPDGQWDAFLPIYESQNKGFETFNCTSFGTLNMLETLVNRLYNE